MSEPDGSLPINEENISGADDSNGTGQFLEPELRKILILRGIGMILSLGKKWHIIHRIDQQQQQQHNFIIFIIL